VLIAALDLLQCLVVNVLHVQPDHMRFLQVALAQFAMLALILVRDLARVLIVLRAKARFKAVLALIAVQVCFLPLVASALIAVREHILMLAVRVRFALLAIMLQQVVVNVLHVVQEVIRPTMAQGLALIVWLAIHLFLEVLLVQSAALVKYLFLDNCAETVRRVRLPLVTILAVIIVVPVIIRRLGDPVYLALSAIIPIMDLRRVLLVIMPLIATMRTWRGLI
jgi:hypothetical protein